MAGQVSPVSSISHPNISGSYDITAKMLKVTIHTSIPKPIRLFHMGTMLLLTHETVRTVFFSCETKIRYFILCTRNIGMFLVVPKSSR